MLFYFYIILGLTSLSLADNDTYITEEDNSGNYGIPILSMLGVLTSLFLAKFGKDLLRCFPCLRSIKCLEEKIEEVSKKPNEPAESEVNVNFDP